MPTLPLPTTLPQAADGTAAAALLFLSGIQTAHPLPVYNPIPAHKRDPAVKAMLQRVRNLIQFGFRDTQMRKAGYPQKYIDLLVLWEKKYPKLVRRACPLDLIPYDQLVYTYNSFDAPHVVCPRCKGYFCMRKDGRIRKHTCCLSRPGVIKGVVLATVVRSGNKS